MVLSGPGASVGTSGSGITGTSLLHLHLWGLFSILLCCCCSWCCVCYFYRSSNLNLWRIIVGVFLQLLFLVFFTCLHCRSKHLQMLPRAPEYWHMWCWSTRSLYPSPWKVKLHLSQRSKNVKMWLWSKISTFCKWRRGNQRTAGWGSSRSHGAPGGVLQYHRHLQK